MEHVGESGRVLNRFPYLISKDIGIRAGYSVRDQSVDTSIAEEFYLVVPNFSLSDVEREIGKFYLINDNFIPRDPSIPTYRPALETITERDEKDVYQDDLQVEVYCQFYTSIYNYHS